MMKNDFKIKDTIAAVSTPVGAGGIGIVRLSGPKALAIADIAFVSKSGRKPSAFKTYTVHYGHISKSGKSTKKSPGGYFIDEVLLTVMRKPHSYTREDIVEINCHGGIAAVGEIFERVVSLGARPAEPGEFTKRAFLNGRIDLAQAEAVSDIVNARTEASLKLALSQLEGEFSGRIRELRERLLDILRDMEADIDFSDEHEIDKSSKGNISKALTGTMNSLLSILNTGKEGMLLREGITCVICGKPNVGKSSLLNALLKTNRAIVTHIPGTTRDIIEESINIGGAAVKLVDTAGITESNDLVERRGIERTKQYLKNADMALFVVDLSRPIDKKDISIMKLLPLDKTILVGNKSDLRKKADIADPGAQFGGKAVCISVFKKKGIRGLEKHIERMIWQGKVRHGEHICLANARHKKALENAVKAIRNVLPILKNSMPFELATVGVREAITDLGMITGETVDINILDRIFERFCIGK